MRVWVFNAERAAFPGGVFSTRELAEAWIRKYALNGVLTAYPVDVGVYDWAVEKGFFKPKTPPSTGRVGGFTSAHQEHYHYREGRRADGE